MAAAAGSQLAAARGQALEAVQAAALLRGQLQRQQQEHAAQMDALQAAADTAAAQVRWNATCLPYALGANPYVLNSSSG